MAELLVVVDEGEVIPFSTSDETAVALLDSGSAHLGEPPGFRSHRPSSRRSGRLASRTPEQRASAAAEENPMLAELTGLGEAPEQSSSELGEADNALDRLAEQVAKRLDGRRRKREADTKLAELVPADAPEFYRRMFEPPDKAA